MNTGMLHAYNKEEEKKKSNFPSFFLYLLHHNTGKK